jgi:EAL domain-containing protein (putative c-di-GMP-specific phosphodiesterase class I)
VARIGDHPMARLGGDEFVVLLDNLASVENALLVADRLQKAIARPFHIGGYEVFSTASIGIATSDGNYELAEEILRDADTAMYRAKAMGPGHHEVFDRAMHAKAMSRLRIENDLRRAVAQSEFVVHYQPIVSMRDWRPTCFEALVRWMHPEKGLVPPGQFIPVAEETGLIVDIGMWVLEESCRQLRAWHAEFPDFADLGMSVNLSVKQFKSATIVDQISRAIESTGLRPHHIHLEITESMMMEETERTMATLNTLRERGYSLSLDDFGTGYSSLSLLRTLPLDVVKIDRSFVRNMSEDAESATLMRSIVGLVHDLGMKVTVEGVETSEELERLIEFGCDHVQGFLLAKPLPAVAARDWLVSPNIARRVA